MPAGAARNGAPSCWAARWRSAGPASFWASWGCCCRLSCRRPNRPSGNESGWRRLAGSAIPLPLGTTPKETIMAQPMMPKATAVWLVENTTLTFEQIADFCGLHSLEVQGIAEGEVAIGIVGLDPTANGQLTAEELARVMADPAARLKMAKVNIPLPTPRTK